MTPAPKWPMPAPATMDDATLIRECARVLANCETEYTAGLSAELARRVGWPEMNSPTHARAVINLAVDELLQSGFTLPQIIAALEDYTEAAEIAARHEGTMQ